MNVEIGAEVALFPEKEYINGIALAVEATGKSWVNINMVWFGADTRASPASSALSRDQFRHTSCVPSQNKNFFLNLNETL